MIHSQQGNTKGTSQEQGLMGWRLILRKEDFVEKRKRGLR